MKADTCRWIQRSASGGGMKALCVEDRIRVETHMATCLKCRDFVHVSEALIRIAPDLLVPPLPPLLERRTILAALDGRIPPRPKSRYLVARFALVGASTATVAAIAVAIILGSPSKPMVETPSSAPTAVTTSGYSRDSQPDLSQEPSLGSYSFPFETAAMPLTLAGNRVWGSKETYLSVLEQMPSSTRIRLKQGKIVAEVNEVNQGAEFVVLTPLARVEVRGTIFSVEVASSGAETVRVSEGTVAVTDLKSGLVHLLSANRQIVVGDNEVSAADSQDLMNDAQLAGMRSLPVVAPTTDKAKNAARREGPPSEPSEDTDAGRNLLREAKEHRKNQRFTLAKQTYLKLIDRYPTCNAAANATVALAQMELGVLGDKAAALGHFDDYLTKYPSGVLAEEAWIGRLRALSRLNRPEAVITMSNRYLEKRPRGTVAPEMLLMRGDAHVKRLNCEAALRDFKKVMSEWPESKAAKRAQTGALACTKR